MDRCPRMCESPRAQRGCHLRDSCALIGYTKAGAFLRDAVTDKAPRPSRAMVEKRRADGIPWWLPDFPTSVRDTRELPVMSEGGTEARNSRAKLCRVGESAIYDVEGVFLGACSREF